MPTQDQDYYRQDARGLRDCHVASLLAMTADVEVCHCERSVAISISWCNDRGAFDRLRMRGVSGYPIDDSCHTGLA